MAGDKCINIDKGCLLWAGQFQITAKLRDFENRGVPFFKQAKLPTRLSCPLFIPRAAGHESTPLAFANAKIAPEGANYARFRDVLKAVWPRRQDCNKSHIFGASICVIIHNRKENAK
jgi:hypothetical protein